MTRSFCLFLKPRFSLSLLLILALVGLLGVFRLSVQDFFRSPDVRVPLELGEPYPISPQSSFVLFFSHRMKKGSVEENLRIVPPVPYQSSWDGKTFFIKPKISLPPHAIYQVSIRKAAESFFGHSLVREESFRFEVGEEPKVLKVIRSDVEKASPAHYLSIFFSHPMVREELVDKIVFPDFLKLDPFLSGLWKWVNTKTLVFKTEEGFRSDLGYDLTSTKPLQTLDRSPFQDSINIRFDALSIPVTDEQPVESFSDLREDALSWQPDASFFRFAGQEKDLTLSFRTSGILNADLSLCKLSLDRVVTLEAKTLRQWSAFSPSPYSCQSYGSAPLTFPDTSPQEHQLALTDFFPDLQKGLYYVRISSRDQTSSEEPVSFIDTVFEVSSLSAFVKRGASALIFVFDHQKKPLANAQVRLYGHDGSLLKIGRTDRQGLFTMAQNRLLFEYLAIVNGQEQIFFNIFSANDYSPEEFGVPLNQSEEPYRFQVLLEEGDGVDLTGVFMVKKNTPSGLLSPDIRYAEVSLMNARQEILATNRFPADDFGNVFFSLHSSGREIEGQVLLSLCIGLFDSECLGSNLWTFIDETSREAFSSGETEEQSAEETSDVLPLIRDATLDEDMETITVTFQNLEPLVPVLITAERSLLYFSEIRIPDFSEITVMIPVSSQMVPEIIITASQPRLAAMAYSMKHLLIPRSLKRISDVAQSDDPASVSFVIDPFESIRFEEQFLSSWYPLEGSSMMTASTRPALILKKNEQSLSGDLEGSPSFIRIPGKMMMKAVSVPENNKMLLFVQDREGNFGVREKPPEGEGPLVSITSSTFIRNDDQAVFDVRIQNRSHILLNIELIALGQGMVFFPESPILIGVQGNSTRTIPLQVSLPHFWPHSSAEIAFHFYQSGQEIVSLKKTLSIASSMPSQKKLLLAREFDDDQNKPELSLPQYVNTGAMKVVLAPSPISFILSSLPSLIDRPQYFWNDQVMIGSVLLFLDEMLKTGKDAKTTFDSLVHLVQERDIFALPFEDIFWVTEALTFAETAEHPIPADLRKALIAFWRKTLDSHFPPEGPHEDSLQKKNADELLRISKALKSLASLTPSGVPAANLLFTHAASLSTESLIMLLLSVEHFRDYGLSGTVFKIEELTQLLQDRVTENPLQTSQISSLALRALVSQASARLTIPSVLQEIIQKKYSSQNQSAVHQYAILSALASYLKLYREKISASTLQVEFQGNTIRTFSLDPRKKFQAFSIPELLSPVQELAGQPMVFRVIPDKPQALFIEINRTEKSQAPYLNEGIAVTVDHNFPSPIHPGDLLQGKIVVLSPTGFRHMVIRVPLPAGVKDHSSDIFDASFRRFRSGKDWIDYVFEELPEGVTVIPFTWEAVFKGKHHAPPVLVQSSELSAVMASSGPMVVTIE